MPRPRHYYTPVDRPPVATLAGERFGACLTAEREVIVSVDEGPLPKVDVVALAAFLRMCEREMR